MSQLDFKSILIALLPKGKIWEPKSGGDFDLFLEAKAENIKLIYDRLAAAAYVRDPRLTTMLSDLEKEYRIIPETVLTESERRTQLVNAKYVPNGTGSAGYLQDRLQEAGFNLIVKANDPAIDPRVLADISYRMLAGGGASFAGNQNALAGVFGGEIIVNQDFRDQEIAYESQANGASTFAGNQFAIAGYFNYIKNELIEYSLAMHYGYWPSVFFIAGGFSGWTPLKDWNMEKPNNIDWIEGNNSSSQKEIFALPANREALVSEYQYLPKTDYSIEDLKGNNDGLNYGGIQTENTYGPSISFDGISQYAYFLQDVLIGLTEITFEAIFKLNAFSASVVPIFGESNSLGIYVNGSKCRFALYRSALPYTVNIDVGIEYEKYYHAIGTWKSGESYKLYINGTLYDSFDNFTGSLVSPTNIYSGGIQGGNFADCEIAYGSFYSEKKDDTWCISRYYDMMKYGVRRLKVVANSNTKNQRLTVKPYLPDLYADFICYRYATLNYVFNCILNNYAVPTGGVTNINSVYGRTLAFDGINGKAYYNNYHFDAYNYSFTIEIVVKIDSYTAGSSIISSDEPCSDTFSRHAIFTTGTGIYGRITINDTPYETTLYAMDTISYHHVVLTWSSGQKLKLYVDGSVVAQSASIVNGELDSSVKQWIAFDNNQTQYLDCNIHRICMYRTEKDSSFITARYSELMTAKVCDLILYDSYEYGFGCSGQYMRIEDLTRNQFGDPGNPYAKYMENAWTKYGRALIFNGTTSEIDMYPNYPVFDTTEHTISVVIKKDTGATPTTQYLVHNKGGTSCQELLLDLSSYPTINVSYSAYDVVIPAKHTISASVNNSVNNIETEEYHIVATRHYDTINTYLKLYVNGVLANSTSFSGLPDISSKNGYIGTTFKGILSQIKMFAEEKDLTWVQAEYADVLATDIENGSYVEQILDIPITDSRDITGVAWGDGTSATPYLMIKNPTTNDWETIWDGTASEGLQHFTATAGNGLSAVRLYNGLSSNGYVSWDDIQLIDPQITRGQVQFARKERLKQLILKHKPMHSWCVLITDYV